MVASKIAAIILYAMCMAHGGECVVVEDTIVTEYLPWKGDAMNCYPPCDMTAFMMPVNYGVTAACPVGTPYNTRVTFWTHWNEQVVVYCQDVCPGCGPWHVDVAMDEDRNGIYYSRWIGGWWSVWEFPEREPELEIELPKGAY